MFICTIAVFSACCYFSKKDSTATESERKGLSRNYGKLQKKQLNEDFNSFISKFHLDTLFQAQRIEREVIGYNSDAEDLSVANGADSLMNYSWKKNDLVYYLLFTNKAVKDSVYTVLYEIESETNATEKIFIPQSSSFYILSFTKRNGLWYLSEFIVNET